MKKIVLFMVMLFAGSMVFAQQKPDGRKPDEQIKVNKEYDEHGHLIGYDSTYVRSWSSDTTMNPADMDAIRKEMESRLMGGGDFGSFFNDSADRWSDPFPDLREQFFEKGFADSVFGRIDTTGRQVPDFHMPFIDFDRMQKEMMKQFGQFFPNDSVQPGTPDFNFFFDPEEFDRL